MDILNLCSSRKRSLSTGRKQAPAVNCIILIVFSVVLLIFSIVSSSGGLQKPVFIYGGGCDEDRVSL
ncbi:hypothetical protein F5B18DRAFT_634727 [Nemania serpens]|nr:hypothetical protein F5B18DRAFT_634727 [Nemania serpens]